MIIENSIVHAIFRAASATSLVSSNGTPTSSAPPQVTTPQYPQQHQAVIPSVPPTTTTGIYIHLIQRTKQITHCECVLRIPTPLACKVLGVESKRQEVN